MAGKTIYQLLERDHREAEKLFERIMASKGQQTSGSNSPATLMETLSEELKVHMAAEEKAFYAPLMEKKETKELVTEAKKEHEEARGLIREVVKSDADVLINRVGVLQEAIDHHIKEEEGKLFQTCRRVLDEDAAADMGAQFEKEKAKLMRS